ncbi:C-terminal processing protease CtpA/Prc [Paenibacillus phyllosphaerae]|uniref:C-terminal processing protease CtpA/Prc n=1 Tax=Paenibacillus phyllosphaerae TaxID=274593 RepID=A0A7W5B1S6_9BACL|nr:S41 family peptidase [Paenibacillus phyllosphaerae]MBB3112860.1 C-terminal processing protease CtpA/Prc [Paenibacillus phyllosphaerae]
MNIFIRNGEGITDTVQSITALLRDHYVCPDTAATLSATLTEKLREGEFDQADSGADLAKKMNGVLKEISRDSHLGLVYSEQPLPMQLPDPVRDEEINLRDQANNYGFAKVERLPGNIGYLVINEFVYPEFAGDTAASAMNFIGPTDGLMIDLRNNSGGSSFMVALVASYLLEAIPPTHLNDIYWRSHDVTQSFWTLPYLPGKRYGSGKPVYLLTSRRTWSGAEEFAYSLQAIGRVTIVGETTGGGANPGGSHRINDHFQIFIPNGRVINPTTKGNWEGKGVVPDIEADSEQAFEMAYELLLKDVKV